jgi:hypothetical protein
MEMIVSSQILKNIRAILNSKQDGRVFVSRAFARDVGRCSTPLKLLCLSVTVDIALRHALIEEAGETDLHFPSPPKRFALPCLLHPNAGYAGMRPNFAHFSVNLSLVYAPPWLPSTHGRQQDSFSQPHL